MISEIFTGSIDPLFAGIAALAFLGFAFWRANRVL